MNIDERLVKALINEQFPKWKDLEIKKVEKSGHDNRTFHLGDKMTVRMPSGKAYASQIEKELKWLPKFKEYISFEIPSPIAKGVSSREYPFNFAINKWIEGETVSYESVTNLNEFACDLVKFLKELQRIDTTNGELAGAHNFYRGGDLKVYDRETREALSRLKDVFDTKGLEEMWDKALKSKYNEKPVWIHGDVAVGNLLVKDGRLKAVIDFGILGAGDPACDYVMAWTFFEKESRAVFKERLSCDEDTWSRAKGWALWKALISYNIEEDSSEQSTWAKRTIDEIIKE